MPLLTLIILGVGVFALLVAFAVLARYLIPFSPVQGFTGTPEAIDRLAQALEVRYNRGPGGTRLYHTDVIALFNRQGQLARMLYGASLLQVDQLESELRKLR
jgi:cytochrome oxidase Cu insertion factor (SCO1/SenC/PrrC family)